MRTIASLIRRSSLAPARDLDQLARALLFNYVLGNCDAQLKNYSLCYEGSPAGRSSFSLAPTYDLVCTTFFPKYSRDMAMLMGSVRRIDDVTPATFADLAAELGLKLAVLRTRAKEISEKLFDAVAAAGNGAFGDVLDSTVFIAEDLIEDMEPRMAVLREFAGG